MDFVFTPLTLLAWRLEEHMVCVRYWSELHMFKLVDAILLSRQLLPHSNQECLFFLVPVCRVKAAGRRVLLLSSGRVMRGFVLVLN